MSENLCFLLAKREAVTAVHCEESDDEKPFIALIQKVLPKKAAKKAKASAPPVPPALKKKAPRLSRSNLRGAARGESTRSRATKMTWCKRKLTSSSMALGGGRGRILKARRHRTERVRSSFPDPVST